MKTCFFLFIAVALSFCLKAQHPSIGGYNVYFGNLHNHTTASDGELTIEQAYSTAKASGMDFFSTADHAEQLSSSEYNTSINTANSYNEDGVFTTFYGFEWSDWNDGHITVTNAPDYKSAGLGFGGFDDLMSWIQQYDCIAWLNHPGREGDGSFDAFTDAPNDQVVGMELWNKGSGFDTYYYNDGFYSNDGNMGYWDEGLVRGWKLGAAGAEDNHGTDMGTDSDMMMAVLANNLTRADLYAAFKARRFYSTEDKSIVMSFKLAGQEMGSTVTGGTVNLHVQAFDKEGNASFNKIMLFKNGVESQKWTMNTMNLDHSATISAADGDFFYVKLTLSSGKEAISSPIWIVGGASNNPPTCELTSPQDGAFFANPQTVTLSANAADTDGTVAKVDFYVNDSLVGTDNTAPYAINYSFVLNGFYEIQAKATDNFGDIAFSNMASINIGLSSITTSSRISNSNDDVEECWWGLYTNSSDIELIRDGWFTGNQKIGLRFANLGIPQGATIENAYIQFTVDETDGGSCNLNIQGHDADDSPGFSSINVSSRARTSAIVNWNPPSWNTTGAAGEDQQTPDLSPVIQEIVNRDGFNESSALSFIITGSGTRTAEAYDGDASKAAQLFVTFSAMGSNQLKSAPAATESIISSNQKVEIIEENLNTDLSMIIYPNPTNSGYVNIKTNKIESSMDYLLVYDLNGKLIISKEVKESVITLPTNQFKPGMYLVRLTNGYESITERLIIK